MTEFDISEATLQKIIITFFAIIVISLVSYLLKKLTHRIQTDIRARYWTNNIISYISFFIGFIVVGSIWLDGFKSLSTYLGLLSAGLAIALKDPITDIAGWLFILVRRPFALGDRIEIGNLKGDVVDQRIFKFTLNEIGNWVDAEQSTGRIIHISNASVFTQPICNYNNGFSYIWNEIAVLVTFESDWQLAKKLLQDLADKQFAQASSNAEKALQRSRNKYMIVYTKLTPKVYTDVRDSGILLTIRHVTLINTRRSETEKMWESILTTFAQHNNIDLAYPTVRHYNNKTEGKTYESNIS